MQTEIAYVTQHREELLSKMDPETRRQKLDLCSKLEEKDALLKLEANLRKQLELINQSKVQQQQQQQHPLGPRQVPVQQNRLQTSMRRSDHTLTNQSVSAGGSASSPVDVPDSWVFLPKWVSEMGIVLWEKC